MNDLIFRGNIDETEVGRVHEGMPVKLTIGALQNLSFDATLEYISPKGVEENGANQFEIKAAIAAPDSVPIQKFERRPIQVGMSDGIKIAIKSGISAQDKIRGAEKKD